MSETMDLLVIHSTDGSSVTLIRKQSHDAFHSMIKVSAYWSGSYNAIVALVSLSSTGMFSSTMALLEPHWYSKTHPFETGGGSHLEVTVFSEGNLLLQGSHRRRITSRLG